MNAEEVARAYGFDPVPVFESVEDVEPATLGGIAEFNAQMLADPVDFGAAWAPVEAQMVAEGAPLLDLNSAKGAFADAFSQLSDQIGITGAQALSAAQQYVTLGHTVLGAANTVMGLVAAAGQASTPELAAQFSGAMIGTLTTIMIASGVVTAGVGAAIVGVVSGALAVMQAAGLFGRPPAANQICPGIAGAGDFLVGCLAAKGAVNAPGGANWRSFPDAGHAEDATWFVSCGNSSCAEFPWKGARYGNAFTSNPASAADRVIDYGFDAYRTIEFYQQGLSAIVQPDGTTVGGGGSPQGFLQAFATAWKANAEYSLNGLKAQDDALVLVHLVRLWNRAHTGPAVPFAAWADPFLSSLVVRAFASVGTGDATVAYQGTKDFYLNTGPLKPSASPHVTIGLHTHVAPPAASSSAAPVVAGLAVAGLGTAAWFYLGRPLTVHGLKLAWGAVAREFFR
jgi:hypothetical protein